MNLGLERIKEKAQLKYLFDRIPGFSRKLKTASAQLDMEIYVPFLTLVNSVVRYNVYSYYDIKLDGKTVGELQLVYGKYANHAIIKFGGKSYYTNPHDKRDFDIELFEDEIYFILREYLPDFQIDPNQYWRI